MLKHETKYPHDTREFTVWGICKLIYDKQIIVNQGVIDKKIIWQGNEINN